MAQNTEEAMKIKVIMKIVSNHLIKEEDVAHEENEEDKEDITM